MRVLPELIDGARSFYNALRERELDLRGYQIAVIENFGATRDQFDVLDLSDNDIKRLDNFPRLDRLTTLLLNNNQVARVAPELGQQLPQLHTLVLTGNRVSALSEIDHLQGLAQLEMLSLLDNPVVRRQHYRLYVVHRLPQVKVLDFQKVKEAERAQAARLFASAAGREMQVDVAEEARANAAVSATGRSAEQVERLRAAIANASTPEELHRLERQLRDGIMPTAAEPMES